MASKGIGHGHGLLGQKLSKVERKALKKQARKFFSFRNDDAGLQLSAEPTRHIIIGNGGLICGMERNCLLRLFSKFGHIETLFMIPGKQYSIISFQKESQAIKACMDINGRPLLCPEELPKGGIILYLAYLVNKLDNSVLDKWRVKPVLPHQRDLHPPGLILLEDFITTNQEKELLDYFAIQSDAGMERSMKHRRVKHYGYEFMYGKNNIDKEKPLDEGIPRICDPIINKMIDESVISWKPNQLTVNQYEPGQGIPPHIDTHSAFEDGIISLSLGSQVNMEFSQQNSNEVQLVLPNRSLLVMKGESRYLWTHGITPRKTDIVVEKDNDEDGQESNNDASEWLTLKDRGFRISLTFRKIRKGSCSCEYPKKCDSQGYRDSSMTTENRKQTVFVPNDDLEARQLEATHVYDVYDEIADHFSDTRHSPWPKVAKFLKELPPYSLVADVGCGNGKYLGVNKDIVTFGSDRSRSLIKICRERGHCAVVSDILTLPYRSNTFDAAISIAVIHHLSTKQRRFNAIKEIVRIVKENGLILLSVWAKEQDKDPACGGAALIKENEQGKTRCDIDSFVQVNLGKEDASELIHVREERRKTIEVNEARNVFKQQDLLVPWHFRGSIRKGKSCSENENEKSSGDEQVYHRFYHVFIEGELEELCYLLGNIQVVKSYHDRGNWCVIIKKLI